jgi:hypothetical protein
LTREKKRFFSRATSLQICPLAWKVHLPIYLVPNASTTVATLKQLFLGYHHGEDFRILSKLYLIDTGVDFWSLDTYGYIYLKEKGSRLSCLAWRVSSDCITTLQDAI